MNQTNRNLQRASAILAIIGGIIIFILKSIELFLYFNEPYYKPSLVLIIAIIIIPILFSLAMIVLGIIFINKKFNSIPITLIVLTVILIIPLIVDMTSLMGYQYSTWIYRQGLSIAFGCISLVFTLGLLSLAIAYLCTQNVKSIKSPENPVTNPTRYNVRISAAILSIIVGCIKLIYTIASIIQMSDAISALEYFGFTGAISGWTIALFVFDILLSLSFIILGALFIKKNSKNVAFTLMAVTIVAIIFNIIYITNNSITLNIILLLAHLVILVLIITYLYLKEVAPPSKINQNLAEMASKPSNLSIDRKIEILKKLRYEKNITEEEYQRLLVKYLEDI